MAIRVLPLALTPILAVQAASRADYINHAVNATDVLNQQWYSSSAGQWKASNGKLLWWNSANMATTLGDLAAIDPNFKNTATGMLEEIFSNAKASNGGTWHNDYYDDEGWWALNWINAYDLTGNGDYLTAAKNIFSDMQTATGATCGGVWWSKQKQNNNAISNELYLSVAASLANRAPSSSPDYKSLAIKQANFLTQNNPLLSSEHTFHDGLDLTSCKPQTTNQQTIWTYNQGVILGALVEMHRLTNDATYLTFASSVAHSALSHLVNQDGILVDPRDSLDDTSAQFKGVFARNLAILHRAAPDQAYVQFLTRNADSIWDKARGKEKGEISAEWQGPVGKDRSASAQGSAVDCLVAAAAVSGSSGES